MVEIPILDMVLITPLRFALRKFLQAISGGFAQITGLDHVSHRLQGKVRIDEVDAITEQQGKMLNFARFAGLQN